MRLLLLELYILFLFVPKLMLKSLSILGNTTGLQLFKVIRKIKLRNVKWRF